jgi:hypothetical protein
MLRLNIPADAHVAERRLMQYMATFQRFVDLLIQRTVSGGLDDDGMHLAMEVLTQALREFIPAGVMQHHSPMASPNRSRSSSSLGRTARRAASARTTGL